MITRQTLRDDWAERQSGLAQHIEHLEHMAQIGGVDADAQPLAMLWLDTMRRWRREIDVLLRDA